MSKFSLIALIAVVALVIGGVAVQRGFAADNAPMPEVGQNAPTFTLPNQEGGFCGATRNLTHDGASL